MPLLSPIAPAYAPAPVVHHAPVVDQRGMVDNWSWGNNRGNLNHRGRCNLDQRGSLVSRSRLLGEDCLALVGDSRVVALGSSSVGDDLDTTVGKVDAVLSTSVGSVSLLGLGEHRVAEALVCVGDDLDTTV